MRKAEVDRERTANKWRAHLKSLKAGEPAQAPRERRTGLFLSAPHASGRNDSPWWLSHSGKPTGSPAGRDFRAIVADQAVVTDAGIYRDRATKRQG